MITTLHTKEELDNYTKKLNPAQTGLVPTMGNLHPGHMTLISKSLENNIATIVTIFVNPKQFGPNEDFDKYPRTLNSDVDLIKETFKEELKSRQIIIFAPKSNTEIYPSGFDTIISVGKKTKILCGANRPGHFDGVTTVVYQLFKLAKAENAYFGQKDFQQVNVISQMIHDLDLNIKITTLPISRDQDGLARSSRNQYLSTEDRNQALILPKTLQSIEDLLKSNSWLKSYIDINKIIEDNFSLKTPHLTWDYIEILDAKTLDQVVSTTSSVVILGALKINGTRLIDNRIVDISYDG